MKENNLQQKYKDLAINIAEKTNYTNKEISYLKNLKIVEYDIASAGFSVIKFLKLLPDDEIQRLEKMEKSRRNIYIGKKIIKNSEIGVQIIETLKKVRVAFVILNKIHPEDILAIKKDAIFLINRKPETLVIKDYFTFRPKGKYTSYLNINGKEFYYNASDDSIEVKGVSDDDRKYQEKYLINDIKSFLRISESNPSSLFQSLKNYRRKYLRRELEIGTYRVFGNPIAHENCKFIFKNYLLEQADENMKDRIDITFNYINYILPLIQTIL